MQISIVSILIVLVIVGVLLWAANTYIPMDDKIKKILNIVTVIGTIIYLLQAFHVFSYLGIH